jgi:hypothetical protein
VILDILSAQRTWRYIFPPKTEALQPVFNVHAPNLSIVISCELNLTLAASISYITTISFSEVGFDDAEQSTSTQPLAGFGMQLVMKISS